ncbi:MAG TPA: pyruvate ferredoxin oxidoreductase [Thermoplasmata archaeon]|nr:pyruvate ferredoxin oxidoreductase [Thermoplasmata archaeon]
MIKRRVCTGNFAAAYGALLSRVQFAAAYPITPQTFIVEHLSEFVNDGLIDMEFVRMESEHSAMSACVSAAATGVRTFTATSSQGLALMHEILFIAGSMHLPIVMPVVNRTVAGPIGIWCEYNDTMPQRDTGWLQCYVEDNQEVLDMVIQAYKIAENENVLLPIMINMDAFILSHTVEPVDFPKQELVDDFLPNYKPKHAYFDVNDPLAIGTFSPPEYIQEVRNQTEESMRNAIKVIEEVNRDFAQVFGRDYHGLFEEYRTEDADVILITLGTVTSSAREIVDQYREKGKKVGLIKLRFFRPFPIEQLKKATRGAKAIGVYDRSVSFGSGGPTYIETRSALYGSQIPIVNFLAGLGGRDVMFEDIRYMYDTLLKYAETGKAEKEIHWIGSRGW